MLGSAQGTPRRRRQQLISSVVLVAALAAGACTSDSSGSKDGGKEPLPDAQAILDSPTYEHGGFNWDAVDLASGSTLYARNENKLNFIGSTTKLITVGTYFDEVGPDATFETPVYGVGTRVGATLQGDLVLVGKGDFILGGRNVLKGDLEYTHEPVDHVYAYASPALVPLTSDPLAGLDDLAAKVKASGITSLEGDVLVDERLWDPYDSKEGVVTPAMVNDNLLDILVKPGTKAGDPVTLSTVPQTKYFEVVNEAVTTAAGSESTAISTLDKATNRIVVSGDLPLDSPLLDLTVFAPEPGAYTRALFIEALGRAGVTVSSPLAKSSGTLPAESAYSDANKVASLTSPSAKVLGALVDKVSHNRGSETLMCLLAVKAGSKKCDDGLVAMISKLSKAGIDPGSVMIYDGEGSDPNSATPAAMVRWLTWVQKQPWAEAFEQGLPDLKNDGKILVKSGLSARPQNAPMQSMFVVGGHAGYITTASNKQVAVAVYALNGVYATVADGLAPDGQLGAAEKIITLMQQHG